MARSYPWADSLSFPLNGCLPCCTTDQITIECRSKQGSFAIDPDDLYANAVACTDPNTGSFSFTIDDIFGVNNAGSPNYNAPNLPVVEATVYFTATFRRGPESTSVEGSADTMFEVTSVSVSFDDPDTVLVTPLTVKPVSWGGSGATDGAPVNVGYCFSGAQLVAQPYLYVSYYDPIGEVTYYSPPGAFYGTVTQGTWPDLCGLCLDSSEALEDEIASIQATGDWTDPGECDMNISVGEESVSYTVVQWKATIRDLTVSTEYSLKIYYDKKIASGDWVSGAYLEVIFTASDTTEVTAWINVYTELLLAGSVQVRLVTATVEENAP